jgi:copper chaperone CopZ
MKNAVTSAVVLLALALSVRASDVAVEISNVHLCCKSCVSGVQKAVGTVAGVTAAADQNAETVSLTGPDAATVQKAADALVAAGYFGTSSNPGIKLKYDTGAKGQKVQSLQVAGVHLCCKGCIDDVNDALKSVPGVKANTAAKGAKSFVVTGDFNDQDVFTALQKAGLAGKVGQ